MQTSELIGITDLVAVNLQCFGLIILGYISRRFNLIGPEEAKGLNIFVSYFSLPAMIFQSLATLPLSNIDFNFVFSILVSKSIIFVLVLLITYALTCKSFSKPFTTCRSAIFAIFCTQSNDFALGYPLLLSLYGNSKTSLANYLYILAPIQLLILNPIALLLIEISKNVEHNGYSSYNRYTGLAKIIFQKIFLNPIIFSTFLGITVNFLNNETLPQVTVSFFEVLSQSFSSVALFLLGLNLYGNFKLLKTFSQPLLITLVLISIKIFIMPLSNRFIVQHLKIFSNEIQNATLSEFAFLYGTFPAAPTVYIFSNIYDIETVIISTGLVISTLFSAPLMFVSANMIRLSSFINYDQLKNDLIDTIFYTSSISIAGSTLLLYSFFSGFKLRSLTHRFSFKILVSHILLLFGAFLFKANQGSFSPSSKLSILQYLLFHVGLFSLKIWACFLSFTLVLLYGKSLCYTVRISNRFLYSGLLIIISYIAFLAFTFDNFILQPSPSLIDLYFGINKAHLIFSIFTSCLSVFILVCSLIFFHHYKNANTYQSLDNDLMVPDSNNEVVENIVSDDMSSPSTSSADIVNIPQRTNRNSNVIEVEDLFLSLPQNRMEDFKDRCEDSVCHSHCSARKSCVDRLVRYKENIESAIEAIDLSTSVIHEDSVKTDFHQVYHHMYLLLFLSLSIVIHLVVEVYHFIREEPTGIYVEIEFLDILLTFSQGFIMFIIFGCDIDKIICKLSKLFTLTLKLNQIYLPPKSNLEPDCISICNNFQKHHLQTCIQDITFRIDNQTDNGRTTHREVYFCGNKLIDWLLQNRLVTSREEGLDFGRHLLYGRVIEHITREHFLCDNTYFYRFICDNTN